MAAQTLGVLAIFAILSVVLVLKSKKRRHAFPPGPPGLPLIGNALDLPKSREWLAYQKWGRDYGPFHVLVSVAIDVKTMQHPTLYFSISPGRLLLS